MSMCSLANFLPVRPLTAFDVVGSDATTLEYGYPLHPI
jgi:hypothetical protein